MGFDSSVPRCGRRAPDPGLHRVSPAGIQPAVFAFPCATLITMMLAFIMYMTLRNAAHQKDMVEVGAQGGWAAGPCLEKGSLAGTQMSEQGPRAGGDVSKMHS